MRRAEIQKGRRYSVKDHGVPCIAEVIDDTPRHPMAWKVRVFAVGNTAGRETMLVARDFLEALS